MDKSFAGPDQSQGYIFSPIVKGRDDISKIVALGLEYYGITGPFFPYDAFQ